MDTPYIRKIKFPEGEFDFVSCQIALFDETSGGEKILTSTFWSYIAVGMPGIDSLDSCSKELQYFDNTKIFAYAQDIQEFNDWVNNDGWDFIILDYEKEFDDE